jgi:beta-lactamase regulating signal transducer with metallopeptidase domain
MTEFWNTAGEWWVHTAAAGGVLLLLGWVGGCWLRGPARRHQMAAWCVRGAMLAAVLSAFPSWLVVPVPEWTWGDKSANRVTRSSTRCPPLPIEDPSSAGPIDQPTRVVMAPLPIDRQFIPAPNIEWMVLPPEQPIPCDVELFLSSTAPEGERTIEEAKPTLTTPVESPAVSIWSRVLPLLMTAYFVVVGVLLLQLVLGHLVLVRLTWAATPLTGKARWVFDRLTESMTVRPRAFVSSAIPSPVCFGFFRSTILLPKALAQSVGEDELRWMLAHELDHVQRGDHRTAYWVGLVRAVFFFVPWFWPLRKQLRLNQEYLADAAAAGAGGRPVDYAAFLVDLSGTPQERRLARPSLASTGVRAAKSDLFRRVNMVLKWGSGLERRVPRGFAVVAGAGVLAAAVGLSGLGFAADPPKVNEEKKEVRVEGVAKPDEKGELKVAARVEDEKSAELKMLKEKIEKAIQDGKVDEARTLLDKLEKATQAKPRDGDRPKTGPRDREKPRAADAPRDQPRVRVASPAPPAPPALPALQGQAAPPVPGVPAVPRVAFPQGNWVAPDPFQVNWNQGPDLREQYEKQLNDFEKAIKDAKDDEAREQLIKARDEYKKAMEDAVKKADAAKTDVDKARKQLDQAIQQNRRQMDVGQQKMLELQKQLEQQLMKDFQGLGLEFPKELQQFQKELDLLQKFPFQPGQFHLFELPGGQFQQFGLVGGRQPRFGVILEKLSPAMVEQLNLEKNSGILIVGVTPGTVAEKIGLKKNDILLRFAGKDVPTDPESVVTMVDNVKAGEKIEVVILRKGKKETFQDVELPAVKRFENRSGGGLFAGNLMVPDGGRFSQMSVQVIDGDVSITATQDGTTYAIQGTLEDGQMVANKITVTQGKESKSYESVDKVPEQHRDVVNKLLGQVRGGKR